MPMCSFPSCTPFFNCDVHFNDILPITIHHYKPKKEKPNIFKCHHNNCTMFSKRKPDIKKYWRAKHGNNEFKIFKCRINFCKKKFNDPSTRCRHERTHNKTISFRCKLCECLYTRKDNLLAHIKKQHKIKHNDVTKIDQFTFLSSDEIIL